MVLAELELILMLSGPELEGRPAAALVPAAVSGGFTAVLLRAQHLPDRAAYALAESLATACRRPGVPLLVEQRVDLALAVGAAGILLGINDLPIPVARRLLGGTVWVGVQVEAAEAAAAALAEGVDFLVAGPVYAGAGGEEPLGPELVRQVQGVAVAHAVAAGSPPCPVVAVGGIGAWNCVPVLQAGANGLVVGLAGNADATATARTLRRLLGEWR